MGPASSSQETFHIHARQVQVATQSFPGLAVQFAMVHLWTWTGYAKIARATGRASGVLISSMGQEKVPSLQGVAARCCCCCCCRSCHCCCRRRRCCFYLFALLLLLCWFAAAAGCARLLRIFQRLPFLHLRRLKSSHLMCLSWWQNFYSVHRKRM